VEPLQNTILHMIAITDEEMSDFLSRTHLKSFKKQEILSQPGKIPHEIFFILSGLIRVSITDRQGNEQSIHFALENQFISDYSNFMQSLPSVYTLQALEPTQVVVIPRSAVEWGYANLKEGEKMGRLIAEYYFIYQDNRIMNNYARTPTERYEHISHVFPNIHNRVPQHMIASYLGITPVHLSRLKKSQHPKI
jgi:signal-transduction protein with cAMP-binding, CBS, and nucleotidyltransferase domain